VSPIRICDSTSSLRRHMMRYELCIIIIIIIIIHNIFYRNVDFDQVPEVLIMSS